MQPSHLFTWLTMALTATAQPPYVTLSLSFTPRALPSPHKSAARSIFQVTPAAAPTTFLLYHRANNTTPAVAAALNTGAPVAEVSPVPLSTLNTTVDFATFTAILPPTSVASSFSSAIFPVKNATAIVTTHNVVTATAVKTATVTSGQQGSAKKTGQLLPNMSNVPSSIPALGADSGSGTGTGTTTQNGVGMSEGVREGGSGVGLAWLVAVGVMCWLV